MLSGKRTQGHTDVAGHLVLTRDSKAACACIYAVSLT